MRDKIKIFLLWIFIIILSLTMIYCIIGLFIIELLFGIVCIILLLPYAIGILFMTRIIKEYE